MTRIDIQIHSTPQNVAIVGTRISHVTGGPAAGEVATDPRPLLCILIQDHYLAKIHPFSWQEYQDPNLRSDRDRH